MYGAIGAEDDVVEQNHSNFFGTDRDRQLFRNCIVRPCMRLTCVCNCPQYLEKTTKAAGIPGLLVHDLRRTGARNLRRAGVDRDTVMKISGWKTDSVFRRYKIVDEQDMEEAAEALHRKPESLQLPSQWPA